LTTPTRRTSAATRTPRRSRRATPRSQTFLERNRSRLLWGVGAYDNTVAIVLGGYVPLALTVIGAVAGIVALSRRRRAVWYPLVALVLSIVVWIVAVSIVR